MTPNAVLFPVDVFIGDLATGSDVEGLVVVGPTVVGVAEDVAKDPDPEPWVVGEAEGLGEGEVDREIGAGLAIDGLGLIVPSVVVDAIVVVGKIVVVVTTRVVVVDPARVVGVELDAPNVAWIEIEWLVPVPSV